MSRIIFSRQLAAEIAGTLSDKEIFMSDGFKETIADVVRGVSKTFNVPLKVILEWLTPQDYVAYVQGFETLALNTNNVMVQGKDRLGRYKLLMGLVLHECGHRLFTDFSYFEKVCKDMAATKTLAGAPHITAALAGMNRSQIQMVTVMFHTIENTVEDGFIELVLLTMFPGYGAYLQELRDIQLADADTIAAMRRNGLRTSDMLHNLLLTYAKYGVVKFEDEAVEKADPAYLIFEKVMPVVDAARVEKSFAKRVSACARILDAFWEALASAVQPQSSSSGEGGSGSEEGETSDGKGSSSNSDEADASDDKGSSSVSDGDKSSNGDGSSDGEGSTSSSDSETSGEESNSSSSGSDTSDEEGNSSSSGSDTSDGDGGSSPAPAGASMEDILDAIGKMPMQKPDNSQCGSSILSADKDADAEVGDASPSGPKNASDASDEQKLAEMAKKEGEQQAADAGERDLRQQIKESLDAVDVGYIHHGIGLSLRNIPTGRSEDFADLLAGLKPVYDALCKRFAKDIKDRLEYSWEDGLYAGARLAAPYRKDMRRFANRLVPEEDFDMAISLYIDLSGSMSDCVSKEESTLKCEIARRTAVILYQFCEALRIPLQIVGHNGYRNVYLWRFKEFDSCDGRALDRISQLNSCVNDANRDGYGLRLCCEELTKRREKCRLMFIVSDGEPAGINDYWGVGPGTLPKQDIDDILTSYGRKGIKFVAAGLGDYAAPVRRLYQEGLSPRVAAQFIDITDVSTMPKTFVNIIKKYLD